MKKLFAILLLLAAVAAPGAALRPSALSLGTETVYIAARSDGLSGSGKKHDPYDASTPGKFETLWNTLFAGNIANKTYLFEPGQYTITNRYRLSVSATNVHFIGYGARMVYSNATTVVSGAMFGNVTAVWTNCSWSGFLFDEAQCTFTAADKVLNGLYVYGRDIVIRDVTVRKVASQASGAAESFAILIQATNATITGCRIIGQNGPYASGICAVGQSFVIADNHIDMEDASALPALPWSFGLTLYVCDSVVSGNLVKNCDTGVHVDNSSGSAIIWNNNAVTGNYFSAGYPVRFEPTVQHYNGWTFTGNTFVSSDRWLHMPEAGSAVMSNFVFSGNMFLGAPVTSPNLNCSGIEAVSFMGNYFATTPVVETGASRYGLGNIVNGAPDDSAFTASGFAPHAALELWGGAAPTDSVNGNRVTNYTKAYATGGFTATTATGVITTPRLGYYQINLSYRCNFAGGAYSATIYTNNVSALISSAFYADANRGGSASGVLYLAAGTTIDMRAAGAGNNSTDASLSVTLKR